MILLSLILLNLIVPQTSESEVLKVNRFQVPQMARVGDTIRLSCLYEISGANLHALKLFKDDKEFYRYTPNGRPEDQKLDFGLAGAALDLRRSNEREVVINIVNKRAAGLFKCQVTVEDTFKSISAEKRMEIQERRLPERSRVPNGAFPGSGGANQQRHALQNRQQSRLQPGSFGVDPMTSMQQSSRAHSVHRPLIASHWYHSIGSASLLTWLALSRRLLALI